MFSSNPTAEGRSAVKPIRRPRGRQALTLFCAFLHPALFGAGIFLKEQPIKAAYRKHPFKACKEASSPPIPSPPHQLEAVFIDALAKAASCPEHACSRRSPNFSFHLGSTYHRARRRRVPGPTWQARSMHYASPVRPRITQPSREEYLSLVDIYGELYSTQARWIEPALTPPPPLPMFSPQDSGSFLRSPTFADIRKPRIYIHEPVVDTGIQLKPTPLPTVDIMSEAERQANLGPSHDASQLNTGQSDSLRAHTTTQDATQRTLINDLLHVLRKDNCTHHEAFEAYSKLPSPGVSFLTDQQIRHLFNRLSSIERKSKDSALRYLSVVDDMKRLNLPMIEAEWNSAIAFCGQCFREVRASNVQEALQIWREMETEANIQASGVTFNILFDMAAKAGKFVLAEMILKEMEARKVDYNRYFRVSNIFYNGLRGNGDGVRRAYRELVSAGEVVDTVVMNCVIAALISAGEFASAESVYARMKRMLTTHTGHSFPPSPSLPAPPATTTRKSPHKHPQSSDSPSWLSTRHLGRLFDIHAATSRRLANSSDSSKDSTHDTATLATLKAHVSITPNLKTYAIFIEHHISTTGNLHAISALLAEMHTLGIAIQGRIFLKIFKGFAKHGGQAYTTWTAGRLGGVWERFLSALDAGGGHEDGENKGQEVEGEMKGGGEVIKGTGAVKVEKWMVVWAVRAFDQCAGREWALWVWEEMRGRWEKGGAGRGEVDAVRGVLGDVLGGGGGGGGGEEKRREGIGGAAVRRVRGVYRTG